MPRYVTLADVAREAGVSLMTVSRVVNNKEGVSQETRQLVQEIIQKLGYRPSSIARSLATHRTGTLGLIVPDVSNPFFSDITHGLEQVAFQEGYSVLLCDTDENPDRELDTLELLAEKRVDGVVVCCPRLDVVHLRTAILQHPAVVLINRQLADANIEEFSDRFGAIIYDDQRGGELATNHLLNRGHQKIGFLAGPPSSSGARRRAKGYQATLAAAGIAYNPAMAPACPPTVEGGWEAARQLLTNHPEITALFCFNDLVAIGALQACAEFKRRVPDDLAIVGYDDIPMARLVTPALTTCRILREDTGRIATRLLIDRINGCAEACQDIVLQPELIIRASAP
jgi:LacI family transcriptional regulator